MCVCAGAKHEAPALCELFFLPGAPFRPDGGGGRRKKLPAALKSEGAGFMWKRWGTFDIALRSPKSHLGVQSKKRPKIFGPEQTEWPLLTTSF